MNENVTTTTNNNNKIWSTKKWQNVDLIQFDLKWNVFLKQNLFTRFSQHYYHDNDDDDYYENIQPNVFVFETKYEFYLEI